ncbi:hypothetical protein BT69DRAFT_1290030 [Atractiella rhizophila]|nr:hypothetical protein BT69DRAFT_1290030 [Atractiella rhizophila]
MLQTSWMKEEPEDDMDGLPTIKSQPKPRQSTGSVAVIHVPPDPQQSETPPNPIPTPLYQPEKLKQIPSLPPIDRRTAGCSSLSPHQTLRLSEHCSFPPVPYLV